MRILTLIGLLATLSVGQFARPSPWEEARIEIRSAAARFPENRATLAAQLASEDWTERLRAAEILGLTDSAEARRLLASRDLLSDPAWPLRADALLWFGRVQDLGSLEALRRGGADPLWPVRDAAARAAGRLRRSAAGGDAERELVGMLRLLVRDPVPEVRESALRGIEVIDLDERVLCDLLADAQLPLRLRLRVVDDLLRVGVGLRGDVAVAEPAMAAAVAALGIEAGEPLSTARLLALWRGAGGFIVQSRIAEEIEGRGDLPEILAEGAAEADRELLTGLLDGADEFERRAILRRLVVGHRGRLDVEAVLELCRIFDRRDLAAPLFACVERESLGAPSDRYLSAALALDSEPPADLLKRGLRAGRPAVRKLSLEALARVEPSVVVAYFAEDLRRPAHELNEVPASKRGLLPNLARSLHDLPAEDALRLGRSLAAAYDRSIRQETVRSLARFPEGRDLLAELFVDARQSVEGRHEILDVLEAAEPTRAVELARRMIDQGDAAVVIGAAQVLANGEIRDVAAALRPWVRRWPSEHYLVRAWARLDTEEEVARFIGERLASDPPQLEAALDAARGARLASALPGLLRAALETEEQAIAERVVRLAGEIRAVQLEEDLCRLGRDPPPGIDRSEVFQSLARLGTETARRELLELYRARPDLELALAAALVAPEAVATDLARKLVARITEPWNPEDPWGREELGYQAPGLMDALALLPLERSRAATAAALADTSPFRVREGHLRQWIEVTARQGGRAGDPKALFELLERDPSADATAWISTWWELGRALEAVEEGELAARAYERALEQHRRADWSSLRLGPADFLRGRDPWLALVARPHLLRARRLPPEKRDAPMAVAEARSLGEVSVLLDLARLHLEDGGDAVAAERLLTRALQRAGPEREILELLAEAARQRGDTDAAERLADRARRTRFGAE